MPTPRQGARPRTLAIVLAGGAGGRMDPLTRRRAKPALPFGGTHGLVDFRLSNCANSGISDGWVVQQYLPHALEEGGRGRLPLRRGRRRGVGPRASLLVQAGRPADRPGDDGGARLPAVRPRRNPGPARIGPDASVEHPLVAPGCVVHGRVVRSVLSPGVVVEKGAVVESSVVLDEAVVRAGARVARAIVDLHAEVPAGEGLGPAGGSGVAVFAPDADDCEEGPWRADEPTVGSNVARRRPPAGRRRPGGGGRPDACLVRSA